MKDAVTVVIQHHVKPDVVTQYELWLKDISTERMKFPGNMGVNIIRPNRPNAAYTILLRFDSHDHLSGWIESDSRQRLMEHAGPWLHDTEILEIHTGLEYWFTPPSATPVHAKPFKQFLITFSAIYPLTLLVSWIIRPLQGISAFQAWPFLSGLAGTIVVVFMMVYLIMPRYTRLVSAWLFK